jgi:hypothetical protein
VAVFIVIINFVGNIRLQCLVLSLRLATVPSSHGGFLQEVQQKGPTSLGALVGIFLLSLSLVEQVHVDGKHINKCILDPNRLVI